MKTYTFKNDGSIIQEERWSWGVVYNDNTELRQFNDSDSTFHQFKEIDFEKGVKLFVMFKTDGTKRIDVLFDDDMQLFHFYRNVKAFYNEDFVRVYVFGWKSKSTSVTTYNFILPDDRIVMSNKNDVDLVLFDISKR